MNYNQYPAIGIDSKILIIQNVLNSHMGFNNVDFYGRVQRIRQDEKRLFFPEIQISNTERKEVYYDDQNAAGGNVFFIDSEKHTSKDGIKFSAEVKIVFMMNLDNLLGAKPHRRDSEIEEKCISLVKSIGAMDVTGIEKGLKNVLSGFNIESILAMEVQPYHTFSINGTIKYNHTTC